MSRDYKTRDEPRSRRRRSSCNPFFWFVTGALLGALGVAVAWMMEGFKEPATEGAEAQRQVQTTPKPRFVYPNILSEMEVPVPDDELIDRPPALPKAPPAQPPSQALPAGSTATEPAPASAPDTSPPAAAGADSYVLQVASFKARSDAERLKAQLALLGIRTEIQQVTIRGKDTYHRVRTGPYHGKEAVKKARSLLQGNGFESIAIKAK